jgi:hypothetical protein
LLQSQIPKIAHLKSASLYQLNAHTPSRKHRKEPIGDFEPYHEEVELRREAAVGEGCRCQWSKGPEGAPPPVVSRSGGGAAGGGIADGRGSAARCALAFGWDPAAVVLRGPCAWPEVTLGR